MEAKEVKRQANAGGPAWHTVRRAKDALHINVYREGFGPGAVWKWALPGPPEVQRCPQDAIDAHSRNVGTYDASGHLWKPDNQDGGVAGTPPPAVVDSNANPEDSSICQHEDAEETPTFDGYVNRTCGDCGTNLGCRKAEATA